MKNQVSLAVLIVCGVALTRVLPATQGVESFQQGTLIIPMDIDYQNSGMLKAFGLVDKLLRAGVPVRWSIRPDKTLYTSATQFPADPGNTVDFTATASDFQTSTAIGSHGYRGGPFLVAAADAPAAASIVTTWQSLNPTTVVHVATQAFDAPVALVLTAAPRMAVLADGNETIMFNYLNAAGIPDAANQTWSATSQSLLAPSAVEGPTTSSHTDGALFRASGLPAFCALLVPHWATTAVEIPEASAEIASFLDFPVHLTAECTAVNAIEGVPPPGGRQHLLTDQGLSAASQAFSGNVGSQSAPFSQYDGPFGTVGGAAASFALPAGSSYFDSQGVLMRDQTQAIGVRDILIAGYVDGTCPLSSLGNCTDPGPKGTVTYLGGHQYFTELPMTANPTTQGTRLFLDSLYASGCVTSEGQPRVVVMASAPSVTTEPLVRFTITVVNEGPGPANDVVLHDVIPAGTTFVAASDGGSPTGSDVTWTLGDLSADSPGRSFTLDVQLGSLGSYVNQASAALSVGLTPRSIPSNTTSTTYAPPGEASGLVLHTVTDGQLVLDWGPSCRPGVDYAVYEGAIGLFYSHASRICSTSGATTATLTPGSINTYYLVVPVSSESEGGYGANSLGTPIPTGGGPC